MKTLLHQVCWALLAMLAMLPMLPTHAAEAPIAAYCDINGDNITDLADLNILINVMLEREDINNYILPFHVPDIRGYYAPDLNSDYMVDAADLNQFLNAMLGLPKYVEPTDTVPETIFRHCYNVLTYGGPNGANGGTYIYNSDPATSDFSRQLWNANELTTDEAICCWGDDGIPQYNFNFYDASHPMLPGLYRRLYSAIRYHNYYLERYDGISTQRTAEVRLLRALCYFHLLDLWGNVPLTISSTGLKPKQVTRSELFDFVEAEILACLPDLHSAKAMTYGATYDGEDIAWGRVDADVANLLLARLYLNAEVYAGTPRYDEAMQYAKKVMDGPHKLHTAGAGGYTAYQMLFMGDNDHTGAATEAILPLLQDPTNTRMTTWGGTTFLVASTFDGDMHESRTDPDAINGTEQAWSGNRARPELVRKFFPNDNAPEGTTGYLNAAQAGDDRALINTAYRTLDCFPYTIFNKGYAVAKFTNFRIDGSNGSDRTFPDGDLFLMRSAEAYLTYAEAALRSGATTGSARYNNALSAVNTLRSRAHATPFTAITLDVLLDEWSREFFFEGRRRSDLIRFGQFGGSQATYNWQWKGGELQGSSFDAYRNVFAIPADQMELLPYLTQNPGYDGTAPDSNPNQFVLSITSPATHDFNLADVENINISCQVPERYVYTPMTFTLEVSTHADMSNSKMLSDCTTELTHFSIPAQKLAYLLNSLLLNDRNNPVTKADFPLSTNFYVRLSIQSDYIFGKTTNVVEFTNVKLNYTPPMTIPTTLQVKGNYTTWMQTMVQVYGAPHIFWRMVYIDADGIEMSRNYSYFIDALENVGFDEITPMGDLAHQIKAGPQADGIRRIATTTPGWYLMIVTTSFDGNKLHYDVQFNRPEVWLIGETIGSWNEFVGEPFSIIGEGKDAIFKSAPFKNSVTADNGGVRAYVKVPGFAWWKSEFMVSWRNILYRGMGEDQSRVAGNAGQSLYLNFSSDTGEIK